MAASSIQFPYTRPSIPDLPFGELADAVSHRCGAQVVKIRPGEEISKGPGNKYVISISLSPIDSSTMFANGKPISCRPIFRMLNNV